jgi:hypothetical protein
VSGYYSSGWWHTCACRRRLDRLLTKSASIGLEGTLIYFLQMVYGKVFMYLKFILIKLSFVTIFEHYVILINRQELEHARSLNTSTSKD